MTRLILTYLLALTLLISIVLPTKALAHELREIYTYILGGDSCHVVNPTTKNAANLRKGDGTIENISDDRTASISCPIPITYNSQLPVASLFADIEIYFFNSHPSGKKKFRCNASGYTLFSRDVVRKWNSVNILSGTIGSIELSLSLDPFDSSFDGISEVRRRPTISCGLRPGSALLSIGIESRIVYGGP